MSLAGSQRLEQLAKKFPIIENDTIPWAPLPKPIKECKVLLATTCGIHLREEEPPDLDDHPHLWFAREYSVDMPTSQFMITHPKYNHEDADKDLNCIFPLDRFKELVRSGRINSLHLTFFPQGIGGQHRGPDENRGNGIRHSGKEQKRDRNYGPRMTYV